MTLKYKFTDWVRNRVVVSDLLYKQLQDLDRQIQDGGAVSLGPVDSKLWDGIANCAKSIKDVVTTGVYPDDATLLGYLGVLDVAVKVN